MRSITVLGIDLAKKNFQIHGINDKCQKIAKKSLKRDEFFHEVISLKPKKVAFEACGSAHYWGRRFRDAGIDVMMIPAQFVKPFVRTNKSDAADAEAIANAAMHPSIRTVPLKSDWHLDLQMLHRGREQMVAHRTLIVNQLRAFLYERGEIASLGKKNAIKLAREILSQDRFSGEFKACIERMLEQYRSCEEMIERNEERIQAMADSNPDIERLQKIPGIGIMTATAIAAAIPDKTEFKNGRHLAAWIGLVPKHTGTGGKTRILSTSKRGNSYLRRLFIQGAGALLIWVKNKSDKVSNWAAELKSKKGSNKAKVALANKTARIVFAVYCKGIDYKMSA